MTYVVPKERLAEMVAIAHQHWESQDRQGEAAPSAPTRLTIAVSRQSGTFGAAIAREVAKRLGWPLYDRELLQRIADDMGIHRTLLESVDERHEGWLSECLASFFSVREVNQVSYLRQLVETLLSLATHGNCVIVGRGATAVLPRETTLRVRIVASLEHRIKAVQRERSLSESEAAARVNKTDRERDEFVKSHFHIDPVDPANYDLVLNSERFTEDECADLIVAAVKELRGRATARRMEPEVVHA